jgi:protein O-mannosyl-transferase
MKKNNRPQQTRSVAAPPPAFRWWPWIAALAALFVVFIVYGPAVYGPFVFDDYHLPFFLPNMSERLADWVASLRPLLMLSFWIDFRLADGPHPYPFHVTNVLLHFAVSVLVALIAARLIEWAGVTGRMRATLAVFCGALFLLHPLQTESVAYVASRSEILSVLFYFAAFAVFLYRPDDSATLLRSIAIIALFGAALATKEHTPTLPLLFLLTDYFWKRGGVRKNWILYTLLAFAGAIGGVMVWRVLRSADTAGFRLHDLTPATFFFTECRVLWTYIRLFFFPKGLNVDPDVPLSTSPFDRGAIAGMIALIALVAAAWFYRKRFPLASYGVLIFLLLIAPTSSIVPLRDVQAEHRMYLPFLGLALVCVEFLRRLEWKTAAGISAAAIALCCVLTYQRNQVWSSELALWQDTVKQSPNKYRPRFQLAYALQYQENRCADAAASYELASHLAPANSILLTDWALALDCVGRSNDAIAKLRQAALLENSAHIHSQIGMIYAKQRDWQNALVELAIAERLDTNYDMTYVYRGNIYLIGGDKASAAAQFERALALNPNNAGARDGLMKASR